MKYAFSDASYKLGRTESAVSYDHSGPQSAVQELSSRDLLGMTVETAIWIFKRKFG
jgi:hypothetical protein